MAGSFSLPLRDVDEVNVRERAAVAPNGIRWPGTSIPGVVTAGTYRNGEREFWMAGREQNILELRLRPDAPYRRIVLGVLDAEGCAEHIRHALLGQKPEGEPVASAQDDRWTHEPSHEIGFLVGTLALFGAMAATSLWAHARLPSGTIAIHVGANGQPNGYGPAALPLLLLLPLPWLLYLLLRRQPWSGQLVGLAVSAVAAVIHVFVVVMTVRLNSGLR